MKIIEVLVGDKDKVSPLQIEVVAILDSMFIEGKISNLHFKNYSFKGMRGRYVDLENYCVKFEFSYFEFTIEFYLAYDQLEYYISKENKLIKECNLEDFWADEVFIEKFISYLKRDLKDIKVSINVM